MKTEGKSLKCSCSTLPFYRECRSIILTGMVKSSYGTITTKSSQGLSYISYMVMGNEGNLQIVDQIIEFNDTVYAAMPSSSVYSLESFKKYLFKWYSNNIDQGNQSYVYQT
ncbi:hypothetical protein FXO37_25938 [Capsicum annuum]|nr:hypothetical protein FXO37_25938 [Capsicum annuum]